jgi:hypothetical protein
MGGGQDHEDHGGTILREDGVNAVDWLLNAEPAIRWQAMRDLTDASPAAIVKERARVAGEGIGAEILALQQPDGTWRRANTPAWLSTLFTLLLLRATGVDHTQPTVASAVARCSELRWDHPDGCWNLHAKTTGGNPFFEGEEEPCINGGVLALGGYFGRPAESLPQRLMSEQLADGGWNCEAPRSTRSSFHTTICVLEGLLEYERAAAPTPETTAARKRGEEYLLQRGLFRRLSTGVVVNPVFLELAFPPRYRYDVIRALDYFRDAAGEAQPDPRLRDAIRVIESKRQPDGRWLLDHAYDESLPLQTGETAGEPSRWNTLRALRVLRWYEHHEAL